MLPLVGKNGRRDLLVVDRKKVLDSKRKSMIEMPTCKQRMMLRVPFDRNFSSLSKYNGEFELN